MGDVVSIWQGRAPKLLLPYQARWVADTARVKVCEKSRRIGITWATACHCVLEAGAGTTDVWYISYNEDSAKEFIRECAKWARTLDVPARAVEAVLLLTDDDGDQRGVNAFQIVFPNGRRITALTGSARNLRGKQGIVIVDEAAFHDNLADVLKAAFALLMWGGSVWIMSTHNGVDNPFAILCNEIRDGKRPYSLHRITIEDALDEGLYRRICMMLRQPYSQALEAAWLSDLAREYGSGVREELYCEPLGSGHSYIGRPLIEARMIDAPVLRLERADDWPLRTTQEEREREIAEWCESALGPLLEKLPDLPHGFGLDFGRVADRTVIAPYTLQQNLIRRFPLLVELANVPHAAQWQIVRYLGDHMPRLFRAFFDAGGNGSWLAEQAWTYWGEHVVERVQLSVKWYAENLPAFREAHERGTIEYPRDLDIRNDVALIRRIDGVPRIPADKTESVSHGKARRHGDAAVALALAYASSRELERTEQRWANLSWP